MKKSLSTYFRLSFSNIFLHTINALGDDDFYMYFTKSGSNLTLLSFIIHNNNNTILT
jgi:hypothetical protein